MHTPGLPPSLGRALACASLLFLISQTAACKNSGADGDDSGTETASTESDGTETEGSNTDTTEGTETADTTETAETAETPPCTEAGCECVLGEESCDPGLTCVDGACSDALCGNGDVEGGEQCDDGDLVDGDGCDTDCTFTAVAAIELGAQHSCVLIDGGAVRCWGRGEFGQLGHGNTNTIGDDEFPSDIGDVLLPGPATKIAMGNQHSCAILQDGGLRCWGRNHQGQLGYGDNEDRGDNENLAALPSVAVSPVIEVQPGANHTCARVGIGEVRCWGHNNLGQLGYGNVEATPAPGGVVSIGALGSRLEAGANHNCVNFVDGGARCWGRNSEGQLGYGNILQIGDDELPSSVGLVSLVPANLPANTELVDIELGANHSCAILNTGDVLCWGDNTSGQLGLGNVAVIGDDETPNTQLAIALPSAAKSLALGTAHTCVLLESGEVMCWGGNETGQLGYGHTDTIGDDELPMSAGPVQLGGSARLLAVGADHNCAVLENDDVVCWGANNFSQLGLGSSVTVGDNETPAEHELNPVSVL